MRALWEENTIQKEKENQEIKKTTTAQPQKTNNLVNLQAFYMQANINTLTHMSTEPVMA